MPKRVLVPSLKVKRLIRLFDSSPSKMTKKKSVAPAAATAVKSATALAPMAAELEKDEAAANRSAATAAPVANTSSLDAMATAVSDFFIPVARKSSSDLKARGQGTRRHSDGEEAMAAGAGLAAGGFKTPKGSAPAISEVASTPKGGHGHDGQVLHHEELPKQW
jgi:hypothetical protein